MEVGGIYIPEPLYAVVAFITDYSYLSKLAVSVFIFLVFWGFQNLFTNYIFAFILKLIHRNNDNQEHSFLNTVRVPIRNLIVLVGIYLALQNFLPDTFNSVLNNILRTGSIILFSSAINALIGYYSENQDRIHQVFNHEIDKILIPFFSKVMRFVVLALAFVAIASTWGYDVNGFIAGLGLGGLAFALAAKDLIANIFSGIIIITDKPFSIGDWIKASDVEGTVEDINFRSTKIRAFDAALVTVPNSNLVNTSIINFTKRNLRRITFQLNVRYDTPSYKLEACIAGIEKILRSHPEIDQKMIFVKFDSFGKNGLEIFLYFFAKTIVWERYLNIKQDINLRIMEVLEKEGVFVALPSTSVYVEPSMTDNIAEKAL
ncbi:MULTISPECIES: mechanosensitive ion channel family protein [Sporomusa]|uniref:mechanosensitive ion channel family protein n=1 Tax=Sporomusa TaxID=2375 RepID=UPI00315963F1